ncbi:uncharacterized protein AMSG_02906 [Thecamonas trahens ATCC 50062]|uniref:AAA+ ATPase domain-containing protein n=1 Tax=Thecamonas trahens ATCC 50062 TaxID=461836 RepID=A0A0L0D277_THETB|nr:hypothetical protein AMSG_02906 [Thecamonas trahens ATCC 50062]KNC46449.1 hypothetical protein AMSG_02906 [Thecamonas trahens ATCC 50062]|eukprot:XP_013760740.1 hypothetical protein AMSG_02906 [Thecamonas trahens ATCC 50062]
MHRADYDDAFDAMHCARLRKSVPDNASKVVLSDAHLFAATPQASHMLRRWRSFPIMVHPPQTWDAASSSAVSDLAAVQRNALRLGPLLHVPLTGLILLLTAAHAELRAMVKDLLADFHVVTPGEAKANESVTSLDAASLAPVLEYILALLDPVTPSVPLDSNLPRSFRPALAHDVLYDALVVLLEACSTAAIGVLSVLLPRLVPRLAELFQANVLPLVKGATGHGGDADRRSRSRLLRLVVIFLDHLRAAFWESQDVLDPTTFAAYLDIAPSLELIDALRLVVLSLAGVGRDSVVAQWIVWSSRVETSSSALSAPSPITCFLAHLVRLLFDFASPASHRHRRHLADAAASTAVFIVCTTYDSPRLEPLRGWSDIDKKLAFAAWHAVAGTEPTTIVPLTICPPDALSLLTAALRCELAHLAAAATALAELPWRSCELATPPPGRTAHSSALFPWSPDCPVQPPSHMHGSMILALAPLAVIALPPDKSDLALADAFNSATQYMESLLSRMPVNDASGRFAVLTSPSLARAMPFLLVSRHAGIRATALRLSGGATDPAAAAATLHRAAADHQLRDALSAGWAHLATVIRTHAIHFSVYRHAFTTLTSAHTDVNDAGIVAVWQLAASVLASAAIDHERPSSIHLEPQVLVFFQCLHPICRRLTSMPAPPPAFLVSLPVVLCSLLAWKPVVETHIRLRPLWRAVKDLILDCLVQHRPPLPERVVAIVTAADPRAAKRLANLLRRANSTADNAALDNALPSFSAVRSVTGEGSALSGPACAALPEDQGIGLTDHDLEVVTLRAVPRDAALSSAERHSAIVARAAMIEAGSSDESTASDNDNRSSGGDEDDGGGSATSALDNGSNDVAPPAEDDGGNDNDDDDDVPISALPLYRPPRSKTTPAPAPAHAPPVATTQPEARPAKRINAWDLPEVIEAVKDVTLPKQRKATKQLSFSELPPEQVRASTRPRAGGRGQAVARTSQFVPPPRSSTAGTSSSSSSGPIEIKSTRRPSHASGAPTTRTPDFLGQFDAVVLGWNLFVLPGNSYWRELLKSVPKKFNSVTSYGNIFFPMVLAETCAAIESARDDGFPSSIGARVLDLNPTSPSSGTMRLAVRSATDIAADTFRNQSLVVVHTKASLAKDNPHVLAITRGQTNDGMYTISYSLSRNSNRLEFVRGLAKRNVFVTRVVSLITARRECTAIANLSSIGLRPNIIHPNPKPQDMLARWIDSTAPSLGDAFALPRLRFMRCALNDKQCEALHAATHLRGIHLLHGPPGTGKSSTILGGLSLLLRSRIFSKSGGGGRRGLGKSVSRTSRLANSHLNIMGVESLPAATASPGSTTNVMLQPMVEALFPHGSTSMRFSREGGSYPLLVCAPSNGAVDELITRIATHGLIDWSVPLDNMDEVLNGPGGAAAVTAAVRAATVRPCIVRVGSASRGTSKTANAYSLDALVRAHANRVKSTHAAITARLNSLRDKLVALQQESVVVTAAAAASRGAGSAARFSRIDTERERVSHEIADLQRSLNTRVNAVEQRILEVADVVLCTLSSSALSILSKLNFPYVVIDEAAQAVEPSTLIPLARGADTLWLVGDPCQLPATVLSKVAEQANYHAPLFTRLKDAGVFAITLQTQYRFHPEIRQFPSHFFYDSQLMEGVSVAAATLDPHPVYTAANLSPYMVVNVPHSREHNRRGRSTVNPAEAAAVVALAVEIHNRLSRCRISLRIAVITPYRGQARELEHHLRRAGIVVPVCTVDSFQGREADIVLLSTVRASSTSVGFLADVRRMNVALTRARLVHIVVCNVASLRNDLAWNELLNDAASRGPSSPGARLSTSAIPIA